MGYYINTPKIPKKGKTAFLKGSGAEIITLREAEKLINPLNKDWAVICVIDNGYFDAATYIFSAREFAEFSNPTDTRTKEWLKMTKIAAECMAGYPEKKSK